MCEAVRSEEYDVRGDYVVVAMVMVAMVIPVTLGCAGEWTLV